MRQKTIVVSAVNLNVGGTLTILRDCLACLSQLALTGEYRIVALVFDKKLALYPNIEYMETQWPKKKWLNRLWYEYVSMRKISEQLSPVYLWLSLHDTTPNVIAEKRAVYCHNPFPFYKWKMREWFFTPKIVLFALFSNYIYRTNIHKNNFVIVQQQWLKAEFKQLFSLKDDQIIVSPPARSDISREAENSNNLLNRYSFIYASSPNSHKNFECICEAVEILQTKYKMSDFDVYITVKGDENSYAKWLFRNWGEKYRALKFIGFLDRETLFRYYSTCNCLIFPSKVETWGLPISEFANFDKPMILADLPYAHETAGGSSKVAFFNSEKPDELALQMKSLIENDNSFLKSVNRTIPVPPVANSWNELFEILLDR